MTAASGAGHPLSHRNAARHGEVRLPASIAVVVAAGLHAALPGALLVEPRWVIPAIELALLVPLFAVNPMRLTRETSASRVVGLVLVGVVIATNLVSLGYLMHELTSLHVANGRELLLAALQVWLTNIVAFALVFWELDRGGAVARLPSSGKPERRPDFLFPQDDAQVAGSMPWIPMFVDYLYVSITNSTAFSPTDTLPLTTRAKALMSLQAIIALVTSLLVIARAVNVLH
jgi:uncharacterized membrane protein